MVFFNYATMQMAAKIVYYGPGLCGKTTNLHYIYGRTAPGSRGEMVSLETETDRTLFFDLLPLDVGIISGFKTRLQLYTVPGQVFYNTTRKLVLKGVDGIVFVADSQRPMGEPNVESLRNLRDKPRRDRRDSRGDPPRLPVQQAGPPEHPDRRRDERRLNADRSIEWYEACAMNGPGVFETLKAISKLTLRSLKSKMTLEGKEAPLRRHHPAFATPIPASVAAPAAATTSADDRRSSPSDSTLRRLARFHEFQKAHDGPTPSAGARAPEPSGPAPAPFFEAMKPPPLQPLEEMGSDVRFAEVKPVDTPLPAETAVRHVRVRSSVDILSELEKLRKISTQKSPLPDHEPRPRSSASLNLDDILFGGRNHRKDIAQSFEVALPREELGRSRRATVTLRFQDDSGGNLGEGTTVSVELSSLKDVQKLLLALKFNIHGK